MLMSVRSRLIQLEYNKVAYHWKKRKRYFSIEECKKRWVLYREYQYWYLVKNEFPLDLWYPDKQMILFSKPAPKHVTKKVRQQFVWDEFTSIRPYYIRLYNLISNKDHTDPFFYFFL